jgi:predicted RNA binding protein YcfA (HicA-like mRNA interferase family)
MGKLPGVNYLIAVKAFERAGFEIIRQSGHIVMSDGRATIIIPRNNPVNAITMFRIIRDSGLTLDQFRKLL